MSEYDELIVAGEKQSPLTEILACEDTGIRCSGECPVHRGDRCLKLYRMVDQHHEADLASELHWLKEAIRYSDIDSTHLFWLSWDDDDQYPVLSINVNDIFYPAADMEDVDREDWAKVFRIYDNEGADGVIEWVRKKRGIEGLTPWEKLP